MSYSEHNLGEVLSLKTVTTSALKVGIGLLGVQDAPEVYPKIDFWLLDPLPIKEAVDLVGKQLPTPINPINPLDNTEAQITVETLNVILVFVFLGVESSFVFGLVQSF